MQYVTCLEIFMKEEVQNFDMCITSTTYKKVLRRYTSSKEPSSFLG